MSDNRYFRLRVSYGKTGRAAMLSHLELTHALERMVRRANLPFCVSQGFSPHMKIAFGTALPVGVESTCELFDVQLYNYMAENVALDALRQVAPDFLMPISAKYIENKAGAASAAFPFSEYRVKLSEPVESLNIPDEITVVRKHKEKTLKVSDYLVAEPILNGGICIFELETKNSGSLRPDLLLEHCLEGTDIYPVNICRIAQRSLSSQ